MNTERIIKRAAENTVWIVSTVHDAHHLKPDDPEGVTSWKDCERGVCASMEHILAQCGFDKNIERIPVRP